MSSILQLFLLVNVTFDVAVCASACYWNGQCPFMLYSTKTPYDAVRGDIRDYEVPLNCRAVSVWTVNRHGNRNPTVWVFNRMKKIVALKDEIAAGGGYLCAQDLENFQKWSWNETLESTLDYLTSTGHEEIFGIAKRIRQKYPHLLQGTEKDYYFRSIKDHLSIAESAREFVHGLADGTNLTLSVDEILTRDGDDIIMADTACRRHIQEVKNSQIYHQQMEDYYKSAEFIVVQSAVQRRLGVTIKLSPTDIYTIYEICRYERSWMISYRSPWCAAFSNQDLEVLEYLDDVRHFYRKGYGSWVNVKLGGPVLKDLYESFEYVLQGQGRKLTSYFTHLTVLESVWSAMGIYRDPSPLQSTYRNSNRLYRTSEIGAFAQNMIVVLNRCQESVTNHRVQFFINEKVTELCPLEGCTWQQFQNKFQPFKSANLDFCNMDYIVPENILNLTNAWF